MANHEGYSLGIQVDFSQLEKANKAAGALSQGLGAINQKMAGMHPSDSLPKGIDQAKAATESYIKLLDSEGKTYQANKERVKTYQSAIGDLSSKQKGLEEQLNRTALATGKSSSAFQTQLVKVNQNATEINKYKGAIAQANAEMHKTNPSIWDRVKNKLDDTTVSANKTHSAFKTILGASLVSNAVMSGFNFVKSSLGEMIHSAHEYNIAQQTMNATWLTLTGNANKGKGMVKQIDDMAAAAQNSTAMVDNLSQKFYAIDKDPKETGQLVKSVLTLQDAFGKSDDEVENFGTQFGQMMANGKVSAQDMMSFVNVFPVIRTNLLKTMQTQTHNHKLTMKQMNELMSKGKISSKTMIGVVESTAHQYRNATDNFNKTIPGMVRTVKSQMPRLMSAFDKPFTKMENPLIKQISKWSTSKDTEKAFNRLGSSVSKGINKAAVPFVGNNGKKVSATKVLNNGIDNISAGTTSFFNWIAKHGKDLKTFGSSIMSIAGTLGKGIWKDVSTIFVDIGKATGLIGQNAEKHGGALHAIAEGFNNLAKNKTALKIISDAIVAMVAVKGAKKVARPFIDIAAHGYSAVKYVKSFSQGLKGITDVKDIDSVSTKFLQSGTKFRDAGQKVGYLFKGGFKKGIKGLFRGGEGAGRANGLLQSAHSAGGFGGLTKAGKIGTAAAGAGIAIDAGASFFQAYKHRNSADQRSQDIGKGIGAGIGGGIGLWFGGPLGAAVGSQIGKIVGGWGGKAVNSFTKGWQKNKPPKKFWSLENLGWSTHNAGREFSKWASDSVKDAKHQFSNFGKWANNSWNGTKGNVNAFGKWANNSWNGTKKNVGNFGKYVFGGGLDKDLNNGVDKIWETAITNSHYFFVSLPKNFNNLKKNVNNIWNETWKSVANNHYVKAGLNGHLFRTAFSDIEKNTRDFRQKIGKSWDALGKNIANNHYVKAGLKGHLFKTAFSDIEKNTRGFRQKFGKTWNSTWESADKNFSGFKKNANNTWTKLWDNINSNRYVKAFKRGNLFGQVFDDITNAFDKFKKGFMKKWDSFWGAIGDKIGGFKKWIGQKWSGLKTNVKKGAIKQANRYIGMGNDINYAFGGNGRAFNYVGQEKKAHALGGQIRSTHTALVGEGGAELAYTVNGSHARILGANGPEIAKVNANEHILNAKDTHKVLHGGLGKGYVLKGYANGNTNLDKVAKNTTSSWAKITAETGKETKKARVRTVKDYTTMRKGVHSQMDSLHEGTISLAKSTSKGFGKALDKMKGYAKDAMQDTIDQINRGISGIDKVLSQFGGNATVIKPVKFAAGSNGRLTQNTLAMVNDAQSGPRQEAIVKGSGDIWIPHGNNRILPLEKNDAVLNGSQTQSLAHSLGMPHFAKGSGVSTSFLKKLVSKGKANPAKSFASMFSNKLNRGKIDITAGTVDLAKNSGTKYGVPWTNAMWAVIDNAIGAGNGHGGTREAFLKYAEATFSGVRYVMGAASKMASDCSGMVMQALRHFNVNIGRSTVDMQHSGGTEYLGKSLSKTVPGDLVIFGHGTGAAGHVGIIKNPQTGTMFNETPPSARVSRISDDTSMGYGFYRIKGLHDATAKSTNAKPSSRLMNLAKSQLGAGAIKWIKDKLGDEGALGANIGGEGVQRWAGTVKRILGMLNLSTSKGMVDKVLRQIQTESGGNPGAKQPGADPDGDGSGPALGLMQTKRATFDAYKRKGAGNIFNGPDNIYAGLNYAKHKYGPELSALGNGHGYAEGGNPPVGQNVLVGEKGPEIARFKEPVHVYSNKQSKHFGLDRVLQKAKIQKPKSVGMSPNVTININGNISSERDARKYADIIDRKIAQYFETIGLDFG